MNTARRYRVLDGVTAVQWFKNGDHPDDYTGDITDGVRGVVTAAQRRHMDWEGEVVRRYRNPNVDGDSECAGCGKPMHAHGWIDNGGPGRVVCPADYIVTGHAGNRFPVDPEDFADTYELALAGEGGPAALDQEPFAPGRAIDPRLTAALAEMGREWGPLGVALAAAEHTDVGVLVHHLTTTTSDEPPAPTEPARWSPRSITWDGGYADAESVYRFVRSLGSTAGYVHYREGHTLRRTSEDTAAFIAINHPDDPQPHRLDAGDTITASGPGGWVIERVEPAVGAESALPTEPHRIPTADYRQAMRLLGLNPEDPDHHIVSVHIEAGCIDVRYGQHVHIGSEQ